MLHLSHRFLLFRKINISLDAVLAGFSVLMALAIRSFMQSGNFYIPYLFEEHIWVVFFAFLAWPVILNVNGLYPTDRLRKPAQVIRIILKSCFQGVLLIVAIIFLFKIKTSNRAVIGLFFAIVSSTLVLKEVLLIKLIRSARSSGRNIRNVLVVGTSETARDIIHKLLDHKYLGLKVTGVLAPHNGSCETHIFGVPVLGSLEQIEQVLHTIAIDHVIITIDKRDYQEVENIIAHCEEEGVEVWLTADIFKITFAKLDAGDFFGTPMFIFRTTPKLSWQLFFKSIIDYMFASMLIIITLPVLLISAVLIKITSPGPVLFKQKRSGLQGREFTLYKLRTMNVGAHNALEQLKAQNLLTGPVFKMERDPRITTVGRWLRKFSIDELPQLFNVLAGDMSLIGPRPPIPDEVQQYKGWQRRRLSMKPGITGLWQVSGRNQITFFDEWVNLDLKYIDNWSLLLDVKIFFKTIIVVFGAKGAH